MEGIRINRSTRDVIIRGQYPNLEGAAIPGFGFNDTGDEEWLIVKRNNYTGDYDQRYYKIETFEDTIEDRTEHPNYPGVGQWVIRQKLTKRDIDEILINLENEENFANEQVMPTRKQFKAMMVALRGLIRVVNSGATPSDLEIAAAEYCVKAGLKIEQNYQTRKDKAEIIDTEPDMSSGWVTEEELE